MQGNCVQRVSRRSVLIIAVLVSSVVLGAPNEARADDPPEDIPAVGAYVELVPTAGGSRQAGRRQGGSALPLPTATRLRLGRATGPDARLLERIATAPEFGAPTTRLNVPNGRDRPPASIDAEPTFGQSLEAVGVTAAGGSDARLLVLLGVLALVSVGAVGIVARRRRAA
jgi:hypothetical protein